MSGAEQEITAVPASLTEGNTYKLTADIQLTTEWVINQSITLDLNGYMLQQTTLGERVIHLTSGKSLTITDSRPDVARYWEEDATKHYWKNPQTSQPSGWTGNVTTKYLYTTGGCITGGQRVAASTSNCGGGVYAEASTTLTISGGNIVGSYSWVENMSYYGCGGGIYSLGSNLVINESARVVGNSAYVHGGGVWKNGGSFTNSGVTDYNFIQFHGAGVILGGACTFQNHGKIVNNRGETGAGGGLYIWGGSVATNESTGEISNNYDKNAGGVTFSNGTFNNYGKVCDNTAEVNGGAIWANVNADVNINLYNGSVITGNHAGVEAGGVYTNRPQTVIRFSGKVILDNNTVGVNNYENNLLLLSGVNAVIDNTNPLSTGSNIGVGIITTGGAYVTGTITSGGQVTTDAVRNYFHVDQALYPMPATIERDGNEAVVSVPGLVANGNCGATTLTDVKWMVTGSEDNYSLSIFKDGSTGDMKDYDSEAKPWATYATGIKTVVVNAGVTQLGKAAFNNLTGLTKVVFTGATPPTNSATIASEQIIPNNSGLKIVVPLNAVSTYRSSDQWAAVDSWKNYKSYIICAADVTAIGSNAITTEAYQNACYTTVQAGLDAAIQATAVDQHTVQVLDDVTESITFNQSGKYVTLDLNDKMITAPASSRPILISAGTLTIQDNAASKTTRKWEYSGSNQYWTLKADQTAASNYTTLGGCITGGSISTGNGAGICVTTGNTLNLNGGNIVGNCNSFSDGFGGGISSSGIVTINNTSIVGNYGKFGGGVSIHSGGSLTMNEGDISYNITSHQGGGLYFYKTNQSGNMTLTNVRVTHNTNLGTSSTDSPNKFAGGIFIWAEEASGSTVTINGATITGNTAAFGGGGIYMRHGTLQLKGNIQITDNTLIDPNTTASNLLLFEGFTSTIVDGGLTEGSNIGVGIRQTNESGTDNNCIYLAGTFTSGIADNATALTHQTYFTSDNASFYVYLDGNNQLKLDEEAVAELYTDNTFAAAKLKASYSTLDEAIDDAANNEGVKLLADVTENVTFSKAGGTTVTLDLNDKVITAALSGEPATGRPIYISKSGSGEGNATLTITDNSASPTTRKWKNYSESEPYWVQDANGTFTTIGGCITGGYLTSGGAAGIHNNSGATLNLNGGNVVGNRRIATTGSGQNNGGGIYNGGTLNIGANATVCGNLIKKSGTGYANGGGVMSSGNFTNYGTISYNTASHGGGVLITGEFTNYGKINNNTASANGGGIYAKKDITINDGSEIKGNICLGTDAFGGYDSSVAGTGGAIFVQGKDTPITINISGSTVGVNITSNQAQRGGGGYAQLDDNDVTVNLSGKVIIINNKLTDNTTESNVLLATNKVVTIEASGLDAGSSIGVAKGTVSADGVTYGAGVITSGYTNVNNSTDLSLTTTPFTLDNVYNAIDYQFVKNTTPEIAIHQHTIGYSATNNVITAECSDYNTNCLQDATTLTLSANGETYSKTAYTSASLTDNIPAYTGWTKDAAISYYSTEEADAVTDGTSLGTTAPTNAGYYYAKYSVTPTEGDAVSAVKAFTIAKKSVAVSGITASNKVYDGNTTADLVLTSPTFTGIVEGDALTVTAPTTGTFADANVGTGKNVTIGALTLAGASVNNYTLEGASQQTSTTADITAREITVTANAQTKAYGDAADATTDKVIISSGTLAEGDALNTVTIAKDDLVAEAHQKTITPTAVTIKDAGENNMTGNYAITYASGTLTETVTFTPTNTWSTYYWNADAGDQETAYLTTVEGLMPYTVTGVTDNVTATGETYIKANTPYLLNLTAEGEKTLTVSYNQTINGTPDAAFKYASAAVECSESNNKYILNNGNFVWARSGSIPAGKCYIDLDGAGARRRVLDIIIGGGEGTTGINGVERSMMDAEGLYDLQGRKVDSGNVRKGLYIKNGRKVVIK